MSDNYEAINTNQKIGYGFETTKRGCPTSEYTTLRPIDS